jgi:putative DNA primase/helicase
MPDDKQPTILKTDRAQYCHGKDFVHIGCYDRKGAKVKDLTFYPKLIADDIMFDRHFATVGDIIFVYKDGVYKPEGEKVIRQETQERLRDDVTDQKEALDQDAAASSIVRNTADCTTHRKNEVVNYIRDGTHIILTGYPTEQEPHLINLKNGFFNLKTWQIEDHTPDIFSVAQVPVIYNPDAKCPAVLKFLGEILGAPDVPKVLELIGYCLLSDYPIRKAFMFNGEGANGKSTLLRLIRAFIDDDNCSTVSIQQLSEGNRFARANLYGKLANIYDDLPDAALKDTGIFKLLTGQEEIFAEWKGKDGFSFHNYAKLIFSCNKIPRTPDDTDAFFSRWEIVEMPNKFPDNAGLFATLSTKEEMEGLLLLVLGYLSELLKRCAFSNTLTAEEMRKRYTRLSDSVGAFVLDCLEMDTENRERKTGIFNAYTAYCRKKHYRPVTENIFFRFLHGHIEYGSTRKLEGGIQVHYLAGVRLKTDEYTLESAFSAPNLQGLQGLQGILTPYVGEKGYIGGGIENPTIPTNPATSGQETNKADCDKNNGHDLIEPSEDAINAVKSFLICGLDAGQIAKETGNSPSYIQEIIERLRGKGA